MYTLTPQAITDIEEIALYSERTSAGLAAARAQGRVGGRPPAMKPQDVIAAMAMLADASIPVKDVARRMGVSVATLYKHIPAARSTTLQTPEAV